jgi:hypothetical protein
MTFPAIVAKTRIFARLEQLLNSSSLDQLSALLDQLGQGRPIGDLLLELWDSGHALTLSKQDQTHLLNHAFGRNGKGWWGNDLEAIASEALAQALTRMLYEPSTEASVKRAAKSSGAPRVAPKAIDCWWMLPSTHFVHSVITESAHQITWTWVTPPRGDRDTEYGLYKKQLDVAETTLKRPFDPTFFVPDNYTRLENIWIVSGTRWALTHGTNAKGARTPCAVATAPITRLDGVSVTRSLCEDYQDRFPQIRKARKARAS